MEFSLYLGGLHILFLLWCLFSSMLILCRTPSPRDWQPIRMANDDLWLWQWVLQECELLHTTLITLFKSVASSQGQILNWHNHQRWVSHWLLWSSWSNLEHQSWTSVTISLDYEKNVWLELLFTGDVSYVTAITGLPALSSIFGFSLMQKHRNGHR